MELSPSMSVWRVTSSVHTLTQQRGTCHASISSNRFTARDASPIRPGPVVFPSSDVRWNHLRYIVHLTATFRAGTISLSYRSSGDSPGGFVLSILSNVSFQQSQSLIRYFSNGFGLFSARFSSGTQQTRKVKMGSQSHIRRLNREWIRRSSHDSTYQNI